MDAAERLVIQLGELLEFLGGIFALFDFGKIGFLAVGSDK